MALTLHEIFAKSARLQPQSPAIQLDGATLTYGQLDNERRMITHIINLALPTARQAVIGVVTAKQPETYAALLAVMTAGHVYLPIDPNPPPERLFHQLAEAQPELLLVPDSGASTVVETARALGVPVLTSRQLRLHGTSAVSQARPGPNKVPRPAQSGLEGIAYIIYTSGSTGRPKGVPVTHRSAVLCLRHLMTTYPILGTDRVLHPSDLCFDLSIAEMFLAWGSGACLLPWSVGHDLFTMPAFLRQSHATVWISVPSLAGTLLALRLCPKGFLSSIRLSMFCGEPLTTTIVRGWFDVAPHSQIVNLYGPTECAICVSAHTVDPNQMDGQSIVPLGRPFPTVRWRLGEGLRDDIEGELLLGGSQVSSGYLRQPELTDVHFYTTSTDRWYRTGDQVVNMPDVGWLFRGRLDHQTKLAGYRVELAEVSSGIARAAGCTLTATVPLFGKEGYPVGLVTYCDRLPGNPEQVIHRARSFLPDYMLPIRLEVLFPFPLLSSGKVDFAELRRLANVSHERSPADSAQLDAGPTGQ